MAFPDQAYGNGADGAGVFNGTDAVTGWTRSGTTYTADRDVYHTTGVVSSGVTLKSAGFRVNFSSTLTNAGTIQRTGNAGANGTPGGSAAGGAALAQGSACAGSGAGGSGESNAVGTTATNITDAIGGNGGNGGGSTTAPPLAGGTGATATDPVAADGGWKNQRFPGTEGMIFGNVPVTQVKGGAGGGGGAGGSSAGGSKGGGGGGGGGGGILAMAARYITNTGSINANGGAGGNAVVHTGPVDDAGGGGGGGGGCVMLTYETLTGAGTVTASGGAGGSPVGSGVAGSAGVDGLVLLWELGGQATPTTPVVPILPTAPTTKAVTQRRLNSRVISHDLDKLARIEFKPEPVGGRELTTAMEPVRQRINAMLDTVLSKARLITGVVLADGVETHIPHGMGRTPLGRIPVRLSGALSSGRIEDVAWTRDELVLVASDYGADVAVDLVVF